MLYILALTEGAWKCEFSLASAPQVTHEFYESMLI